MESASKLPFKPRVPAAERRRMIERAAEELFAVRGYEESTLDEIAGAAGVTKRVIYDHFSSKRDLQIALLREHADELLELVAAEALADAPAERRLAAGLEVFFGFAEEHPYAWRLMFRDPPTDPEIAAAHAEIQARATEALVGFLSTEARFRPPSGGEDSAWLEMVAEQLKSALDGLAAWWYEHRDVPRERIVATALDFAWEGLGQARHPR